jgi:predicted acetyltransferase
VDPGEIPDGDLRLELVRFAPHTIHVVPTYHFRMVHAATRTELGQINLRLGSSRHIEFHAGHVGYFVHSPYHGNGYATRSLRLLFGLARAHGLDPLWITCDPANTASQRTLNLVGARFVEIVDLPPDCVIYRDGKRRKMRFVLPLSVESAGV